MDRDAKRMAVLISKSPDLLEMCRAAWHNQVIPYYDLCAGCGSLPHFLRRLEVHLEEQVQIIVKFECLLHCDIDKTSRNFIIYCTPNSTVPVFGNMSDILSPRAWCYRAQDYVDVPRRGSNGAPPKVISGIDCGAASNANNHRKDCGETLSRRDSKTAATFHLTQAVCNLVQATTVLYENSRNVEGKTVEVSVWDEMRVFMRSASEPPFVGSLVQLAADDTCMQTRKRAYMYFRRGAKGLAAPENKWECLCHQLAEAFIPKDPIEASFLSGSDASKCPWIAQFSGVKRMGCPYERDLASAEQDYVERSLTWPPVLDSRRETYNIPEGGFFGGVGNSHTGLCERSKFVMHWLGNTQDCFTTPMKPQDVVGVLALNASVSRFQKRIAGIQKKFNKQFSSLPVPPPDPMIKDWVPTVTQKAEWWGHIPSDDPEVCRSSILSPQEHFAFQMMPLVDLLPEGTDLADAAEKFGYFEMVSLAGRAFNLHNIIEAFLAVSICEGVDYLPAVPDA